MVLLTGLLIATLIEYLIVLVCLYYFHPPLLFSFRWYQLKFWAALYIFLLRVLMKRTLNSYHGC